MYKGYNKIPLNSSEWKNFNSSTVKHWYITEKVHGSCFCFIFDIETEIIKCGKRKGILSPDETFFGYMSILPILSDKIKFIAQKVKSNIKSDQKIVEVYVFGELFGAYNGVNVQNGIYYSDELHFYAFDISYMKADQNETYLDFENSLKIFESAKILYAKPLAKFNKLEQATNFNYNFQSTIARQLGKSLGDVTGDNKAEGVVIRSSHGRYLVKRKIDEFSESKYQNNDYDGSEISALDNLKNSALKCLTLNRLNNAISKYGEYMKYKELILEELCLDIIDEINGYSEYELKEWLDTEINKFVVVHNM